MSFEPRYPEGIVCTKCELRKCEGCTLAVEVEYFSPPDSFGPGAVPHNPAQQAQFIPAGVAAPGVQQAQSSSAWGSTTAAATTQASAPRKHNHYFKNVSGLLDIDVYRVLQLFNVTNPCLQHAVKKLLVAGGRGAGKNIDQDIKEAIDTLQRWQEMRDEDAGL